MNPAVVVSGGFDDIRSRQIRFLEEASKLGPLTIQLWSDEMLEHVTGKPPKFPAAERLYFLQSVRYVCKVELQSGIATQDRLHCPQPAGTIWAVERAGDTPEKRNFAIENKLDLRIISDAQLAGFPQSESAVSTVGNRKRVIVTGCYDWFHSGHVRFFEEASQHGDLYVVVGHDANIRLLKGEGRPLFPEAERRYVVGSIRYVKEALISSGHGWLDAEPEMAIIKPDIYAVNEDGDVPEKRAYCAQHGLQYLVLKRTPAPGLPQRSSTSLRGF